VTQEELDQTLEQFKEQFGDKPRYFENFLVLILGSTMTFFLLAVNAILRGVI
jgi:hypothetical protein